MTLWAVTAGLPGTLNAWVVTVRPGMASNCATSQSRAPAIVAPRVHRL